MIGTSAGVGKIVGYVILSKNVVQGSAIEDYRVYVLLHASSSSEPSDIDIQHFHDHFCRPT